MLTFVESKLRKVSRDSGWKEGEGEQGPNSLQQAGRALTSDVKRRDRRCEGISIGNILITNYSKVAQIALSLERLEVESMHYRRRLELLRALMGDTNDSGR